MMRKAIGVIVVTGVLAYAGWNACVSIKSQTAAWNYRTERQIQRLEYYDYAPNQECDTDTDCMNKFGGDGGYGKDW